MLHLLDKVYFDYDFTGNVGREKLVLIGRTSDHENTGGVLPLHRFPSLTTILTDFGDINTFIECLVPLNEKITLMLEEDDLNQLLVLWLRSVFPEITVEMVHRFVKLNAVNHKYEHGSRTNSKGSKKEGFQNLTIPKLAQTKQWYDRATPTPLSYELKTRVSFEYLLAHALLTDFDPEDIYVQSLTERMETILWKSIAWDFVGIRRDMLYGMYNLKQNFGIDLDLERDDIDEQIEQLRDVVLFSPDNHPGNVDFIKRNHRQLHEYSKRVAEYNGNHDRVFDWLMSVLPDGPFTPQKAKALVAEDRTMHCSQIFGRTEFRNNMNNNFIGYLYQAEPGEFACLNLKA